MENILLGALIVLIAFCLGMLFEFFLHIKEMVAYVKEVNKANSTIRQFEKKMKNLEIRYLFVKALHSEVAIMDSLKKGEVVPTEVTLFNKSATEQAQPDGQR